MVEKSKTISEEKEKKFKEIAANSVVSFLNNYFESSESTDSESDTIRRIGLQRQRLKKERKMLNLSAKTTSLGIYKSGRESSKSIKKSMKKEISKNSSLIPAKLVKEIEEIKTNTKPVKEKKVNKIVNQKITKKKQRRTKKINKIN